jgi:hypothetical protein
MRAVFKNHFKNDLRTKIEDLKTVANLGAL